MFAELPLDRSVAVFDRASAASRENVSIIGLQGGGTCGIASGHSMNATLSSPSWSWLPRGFAVTRWSLIRRVRQSGDKRDAAVEEVCRLYWYPLYAFLRTRGYPRERSQDLVQSFMCRMLEKGWLAKADQERGKFRSFLLTLLVRHVAADEAMAGAMKRGGCRLMISFDWASAEAFFATQNVPVDPSPEEIFRRALAVRLIEEAMELLRARYEASGQSTLLEALLPTLEGPLPDETYGDVAERLGSTEGAIKVAVSRMRSRFRTALREAAAIALRRDPGPGLDDELRELFG